MSTIANAKVEHNYNRYNGYFFGCLPYKICLKSFMPRLIKYSSCGGICDHKVERMKSVSSMRTTLF